MSYSAEALAFSQIPPHEQIRLEDRLSFLYLEYCLVRQDRTGVVAISRGEETAPGELAAVPEKTRIQLPVGGLAVLMLGPGTSISQPAATSCARAGVVILFTGAGMTNSYCLATPLTSTSKWAIAQARLVSNEARQRDAAVKLYKHQLGLDDLGVTSIKAMRGVEGKIIRNLYKQQAAKHKIRGFKRDTNAPDAVNMGLNLANSILYGCAAAACSAIGVNPALGVIHRGNSRSLLFDLADLYKPTVSIPIAFQHAFEPDFSQRIRQDIRGEIKNRKILANMLAVLMEILEPHLPMRDDDRLIGGKNREVAGHVQYGKE